MCISVAFLVAHDLLLLANSRKLVPVVCKYNNPLRPVSAVGRGRGGGRYDGYGSSRGGGRSQGRGQYQGQGRGPQAPVAPPPGLQQGTQGSPQPGTALLVAHAYSCCPPIHSAHARKRLCFFYATTMVIFDNNIIQLCNRSETWQVIGHVLHPLVVKLAVMHEHTIHLLQLLTW